MRVLQVLVVLLGVQAVWALNSRFESEKAVAGGDYGDPSLANVNGHGSASSVQGGVGPGGRSLQAGTCSGQSDLVLGENAIAHSSHLVTLSKPFSCATNGGGALAGRQVLAMRFMAPRSGVYSFTVAETSHSQSQDTIIQLRRGNSCNGEDLACDDDSGEYALSNVGANLAQGETITVMVAMLYSGHAFEPKGTTRLVASGPLTCTNANFIMQTGSGTTNVIDHTEASVTHVTRPLSCSLSSNYVGRKMLVTKFTAPRARIFHFDTIVPDQRMGIRITEVRQGDDCEGRALACSFETMREDGRVVNRVSVDLDEGETVTVISVGDDSSADGITIGGSTSIVVSSSPSPTRTASPTRLPSESPTARPTHMPSGSPSTAPSFNPTMEIPSYCGPSAGLIQELCNNRIAACPAFGVQLKWVSGCGQGDGGCQCAEYCGYKCREACQRDSGCYWSTVNALCFSRATNLPGLPITLCQRTPQSRSP